MSSKTIAEVGNLAFGRVTAMTTKDDGRTTNSHIKVVVRVRPENNKEREGGFPTVIRVMDENMLIFDPQEVGSPDFYHGKKRRGRNLLKRKNRDIRFLFDRVFTAYESNEEVYNGTTKFILESVLDGYNCSVFAYGATGAGKTFTMLGTFDKPGIVFLTMMDLYRKMEEIKNQKTCDIAISYLEVYNEQIHDLLVPGGSLPLREDPSKGVIITGLSLHKPKSAEELMQMLYYGNQNRTQHPTDANAESSRSHAVFQVFVRQKDRTAGMSADVQVAKMSLIDLAGSERSTATSNIGARFRESANINKSLLALGNCINALADGKKKGFVPYRNSKLTRLLKDSLGGNCRTVMIAAVSPSSMTYEDTCNTLKYADRAKNIKASLKRNVVSVDFHVSKYVKIIDELRQEVSELKTKVQNYENGTAVPVSTSSSTSQEEIEKLQGDLLNVFYERKSICKEAMELEASHRDLAYKIHRNRICLENLNHLYTDTEALEKAKNKLERSIVNAEKRRCTIKKRKLEFKQKLEVNMTWLNRVKDDMKLLKKDGQIPQILEMSLENQSLEVELLDTQRQVKYLKKLCRAQEMEVQSRKKLFVMLMSMARKQFYILKGHGLATSDLIDEFESVQNLAEHKREVAWADQSNVNAEQEIGATTEHSDFDFNALLEFPVIGCTPTPARTRRLRGRRKSSVIPTGILLDSCTKGASTTSSGLCLAESAGQMISQLHTGDKVTNGGTDPITSQSATEQCLVEKPDKQECQLRCQAAHTIDETTVTLHPADVATSIHQASTPNYIAIQNSHHKSLVSSQPSTTNNLQSVPHPGIDSAARHQLSQPDTDRQQPSDSKSFTQFSQQSLNDTFNRTDSVFPISVTPTLASHLKHHSDYTNKEHSNMPPHDKTEQSYPRKPVYNSETSTQVEAKVNSGTVTKQPPKSVGFTDENAVIGHNQKTKPTAARSMNFSDYPSPAGKLSFAEVVKSPPVKLNGAPGTRSALISRDNVQFPDNSHLAVNGRRMTFATQDMAKQRIFNQSRLTVFGKSVQRRQTMSANDTRTTDGHRNKMASSTISRKPQRVQSFCEPKARPNYMQMTKSTSVKQRGSTIDGNSHNPIPVLFGGAQRIALDDKPARHKRVMGFMRSKSAARLNKTSAVF